MEIFSEEQIKEIQALVAKTMGLEGDQKFTDVVNSLVNDTLNAYDRRLRKDREKADDDLSEKLKGIEASLGKLTQQPAPDPNNPPKKPGEIDLSKVPDDVRALITQLSTNVEELKGNFDRSEKAREKAEDDRKRVEAEQKAANIRNQIRDTLLNREAVGADFDPDGLDMLVRELEPRISAAEDGALLFDTGKKADITNDPILKPLAEGLKGFAGTAIAKKFQRAQPGTPPGTPPGIKPGELPPGSVPGSSLEGKSAKEISELAGAGKIDYSQ